MAERRKKRERRGDRNTRLEASGGSVNGCSGGVTEDAKKEKNDKVIYVSCKTDESEKIKEESKVVQLQEGLVLIRDFLTPEVQKKLVSVCFAKGDGPGGFYESDKGFKLNQGIRGRMIDHVDSFPKAFQQICLNAVDEARKHDKSIPEMSPTTLLINYYKVGGTMKWHKDSENPKLIDTNMGKPVVRFHYWALRYLWLQRFL